MKEARKKISVEELLTLLTELKKNEADTCVRVRLQGEMWENNFLRVIQVSGRAVMLADVQTNKAILLSDVSSVIQFELDNRFQNFQPHFHYDVKLLRAYNV
jgi:hypothetical protein